MPPFHVSSDRIRRISHKNAKHLTLNGTMDIPLIIDATTIIGLLAIAQAILLCFYLLCFYPKKSESWVLSCFLGSIIIALGHDVLLHSHLALYVPAIIGFGPFSTYLTGPLILLIAVKLLWPERHLKWYDALHLLPFAAHFIHRWPKYSGDPQQKFNFLQSYYQNSEQALQKLSFSSDVLLGMLSFYGHRFIYIGFALFLLLKFNSIMTHALPARQRFYRLILSGLVFYCSGWLLLRTLKFFTPTMDTMINALTLAVAVLALALTFFRFSLDQIFSSKSTQKYRQSPMEDDISKQIVEQLEILLQENQLFTHNDLKQSTLVQASGFSAQQISQALNSQGVTFNDFVNQYRLSHIKAQLANPENQKADIQQLALDSGFNSKATFYRVFKEKVGMTPSEYRKQSNMPKPTQ